MDEVTKDACLVLLLVSALVASKLYAKRAESTSPSRKRSGPLDKFVKPQSVVTDLQSALSLDKSETSKSSGSD